MPLKCLESDLDATFASSGFGEANGAVLNGDETNTIQGIFDDEDVENVMGEGEAILTSQITFTCAWSKVSGIERDQILQIRDTNYTVKFWKKEGDGSVVIFLEE